MNILNNNSLIIYGILLILTIGNGITAGTSILNRRLSNVVFINDAIIPQNNDDSTDLSMIVRNNNNKIYNHFNNEQLLNYDKSDSVENNVTNNKNNKNKNDRKNNVFANVVVASEIRINAAAAADATVYVDDNKIITKPSDMDFFHAFISSLCVILVSELGDKTFFIAAIMAMRNPRVIVFTGAITALTLMTILSAVFGMAAQVIPHIYTFYISTALFALFGLKMLRDGYYMSASDVREEFELIQLDLKKREDNLEKETICSTLIMIPDAESGVAIKSKSQSTVFNLMVRILMQAFTMTFLAEWGDRSQLTTIILAARENVLGVILGGVIGHSLCTGLAVIGGRMIAQRISVRTVTFLGGVVFILFAISALFLSSATK